MPDATEFSPQDLVSAVVRDHAAAAATKRLHLDGACEVSLPERWYGPAAVITRTLGLLIDNAVKFTARGSVIVRCHPEDGALTFCVTDTGLGMTPNSSTGFRFRSPRWTEDRHESHPESAWVFRLPSAS
jgi:signal transduction histidine kinase